MTWFSAWTIAGWVILGLIVVGIAVLLFAMWRDSKLRADRDVAAPTLAAHASSDGEAVFGDDKKSGKSPLPSRRSLRRKSSTVVIEDSSSGSLWADDDDDNFNFADGRD